MALSDPLTAQERAALGAMLAAGVSARDALAALRAAAQAGQVLPTDAELDVAAQEAPDYGWWQANPAVPPALRGLLDAAPRGEDIALAFTGGSHARPDHPTDHR